MREELAKVDPETAARLKPNDRQRISRAIEVYRMTGRPMSAIIDAGRIQLLHSGLPRSHCFLKTGLALHAKIAERFDAMLEAGFLDEMKRPTGLPGFDRSPRDALCRVPPGARVSGRQNRPRGVPR